MEHAAGGLAPASSNLLGKADPSPVLITNPEGASPFLLIGDHAGRCIPGHLADLGLRSSDLDLHIALDIGVEGLGVALSSLLDAAFIHQTYSRLVIDCNRAPGTAGSILSVSDGVTIPGNQSLSEVERRQRQSEIFQPYHDQIAVELDRRADQQRPTTLIFLHSFTPALSGAVRPWRFGVLHGLDSAYALAVLDGLRQRWPQAVGDNEPYALDDTDYSAPLHAQQRGLSYVELEVRQDMIELDKDQKSVAMALADVFSAAL